LQKSSLEGTATSDKKITTSLKVGVGDGWWMMRLWYNDAAKKGLRAVTYATCLDPLNFVRWWAIDGRRASWATRRAFFFAFYATQRYHNFQKITVVWRL
jgi:hypothetical protein